MPDFYMDVDTALSEVPVNILALTDDTDFKTRETGITYDQAGMDLVWNFITTGGAYTQTAVTPTTSGDYDWAHQGDGMYSIEITASGGASINNDTEGVGWFTGLCTGVLPWRGPTIGLRAAGLNNLLIDSAYSATRGLSGTALPAAAADAAGGLPLSDAGGLDIDTQLANTHEITAARMGVLTDWINDGRLDLILDEILVDTSVTIPARTVSSTAAGNIEDTYDGTGYTNDAAPATQAQIGKLSSGSAAINTVVLNSPDGFIITTGTNEVNDEDDTHQLDGIVHSLEDDGGTTEAYYLFNIGGNGVPVNVTWDGYANPIIGSYDIFAYNWITTSWDQIGVIDGAVGTTVVTEIFILTIAHVGTGGDLGDICFRYYSTDGTNFATDRVLCSYSVVFQSVGYADGAVWIDTNASNTNTESYVDGVADNPVSTLAAATTVATNMGLRKFILLSGSSITLAQAYEGYQFYGPGSSVALGGQSISGSRFSTITISGDDSGTNAIPILIDTCLMLGNKLSNYNLLGCGIIGDMEFGEAGSYIWDKCLTIAGVSINFGASLNASIFHMTHHAGEIEVQYMGAGTGTYYMSLDGNGELIVNANCSATSTIAISGNFSRTDNSGGAVTFSDAARFDVDQITDAVVDDATKLDGSALNALSANDPGSTLATEAKQDIMDTNIDQIEAAVITNAAGVDIAADIIAVKAETASILADTATIERALGLAHENFRVRDQIYDSNDKLTSATIRIYGNATDCNNDTNEIAEYTVTATYDIDSNCDSYKSVKV